ncbi:hypothetical protein, partial [Mesorhizobium sp.]|uniref:hypothetical protein n=1 Tax=Mesorhizobium sp. TaxID=1871066 RepID=UPI0025E971DF
GSARVASLLAPPVDDDVTSVSANLRSQRSQTSNRGSRFAAAEFTGIAQSRDTIFARDRQS